MFNIRSSSEKPLNEISDQLNGHSVSTQKISNRGGNLQIDERNDESLETHTFFIHIIYKDGEIRRHVIRFL